MSAELIPENPVPLEMTATQAVKSLKSGLAALCVVKTSLEGAEKPATEALADVGLHGVSHDAAEPASTQLHEQLSESDAARRDALIRALIHRRRQVRATHMAKFATSRRLT